MQKLGYAAVATGAGTTFGFDKLNESEGRSVLRLTALGAANQIRTDDLILTKDVLYQLSHSSILIFELCSHSQVLHYYSKSFFLCQAFFIKKSN